MINVYWERWEQGTEHSIDAPEKGLIEAINASLDKRHPEDDFKAIWNYWWSKFPEVCTLVTLTQGHFHEVKELRFWFGEPTFYGSEHIDSNGHNLILTVAGGFNALHNLVNELLPKGAFEKTIREPDDKETITVPSKIVVWRRINK